MRKKKLSGKGFDFDNTLTEGFIPGEGDVIITGRTADKETATRGEMALLGVPNELAKSIPIYFYPNPDDLLTETRFQKIAEFKAKIIKDLGLTLFYEDEPAEAAIIREANPGVEYSPLDLLARDNWSVCKVGSPAN